MIGAIIGDIIGSPYEGSHKYEVNEKDFYPLFHEECRFTDDTVLTCATAHAILSMIPNGKKNIMGLPGFGGFYRIWALKYPDRGYGSGFKKWVKNSNNEINNSYANGCIMRCSPISLYYSSFQEYDMENMLKMAQSSIYHTHNSPESLRGIQSICSAIYMASKNKTKEEIKSYVEEQYGHMCDASVLEVRHWWPKNTIRCNIYASQSLIAFLNSTDYESTIRNAVFMRGDTDTTAAIAGSIAEAFYGTKSIPQYMIDEAKKRLTPEMIKLINDFYTVIENNSNKGFKI